jgi:hypothetical protein
LRNIKETAENLDEGDNIKLDFTEIGHEKFGVV